MGLEIEEIATLYGEYQQVLLEITPAHHPKLYFDTGFGLGPGSAGTLSNGVITIDLSTLLLFSPDERKAAFAHELKHLLGSDNLFYNFTEPLTNIFIVISPLLVFSAVIGAGWPLAMMFSVLALSLPVFISKMRHTSEYLADAYAVKVGYGKGLIAYFDRWISINGITREDANNHSRFSLHPNVFLRIEKAKRCLTNEGEG